MALVCGCQWFQNCFFETMEYDLMVATWWYFVLLFHFYVENRNPTLSLTIFNTISTGSRRFVYCVWRPTELIRCFFQASTKYVLQNFAAGIFHREEVKKTCWFFLLLNTFWIAPSFSFYPCHEMEDLAFDQPLELELLY